MSENPENPDDHILSGFNELAKPWKYGLRKDFENIPLEEMLESIDEQFEPSLPLYKLSIPTWRFEKRPNFVPHHPGRETVLERSISVYKDDKWANQVPTSSGFRRQGGGTRNIDLVFESADSNFVFYELKVGLNAGDAFSAAFELLGYGLLYIYSRASLAFYKERHLMKARAVDLRVLGTCGYWDEQKAEWGAEKLEKFKQLKQFQGAISRKLNRLVSDCLLECKMDFGFYTFPEDFSWSVADKDDKNKILTAVDGIKPLFP